MRPPITPRFHADLITGVSFHESDTRPLKYISSDGIVVATDALAWGVAGKNS